MLNRIVGIDPGLSGGLAFFEEGTVVALVPMPVRDLGDRNELDMPAIAAFLVTDYGRATHVFIERAQVMSKPGKSQGVTGMFNYGIQNGMLRGLCHGLGLPYTLVHPQSWQRAMLGAFAKGESKAAAAVRVSQLWPSLDFRASERCKKAHEGMVDAALIAEHGRRALFPKEVPV